MFWKKQLAPRWVEKRILQIYEEAIQEVELRRREVNAESAVSDGKPVSDKLLRKYSYALGEVVAVEAIMDRLFIQYDDRGRVKELPL